MTRLLSRPSTPAERIFSSAAPRILYATLQEYFSALYPDVYAEQMESRDYAAAVDALPSARLSRIQSDLPMKLQQLGIRCTIETFPNTTRTYLLIHISELVKLVICYVRHKGKELDFSLARQQLAEEFNSAFSPHVLTPSLFCDGKVFGILKHHPLPKDIARFGGAEIVFPAVSGTVGLGSLDLLQEMEKVQQEDIERAMQSARKVAIKIKKKA